MKKKKANSPIIFSSFRLLPTVDTEKRRRRRRRKKIGCSRWLYTDRLAGALVQ